MTTLDLENRLLQAALIATPPRPIADDVMRQLPIALPLPAPRSPWPRRVFAAGLAALTAIAALIALAALLTGPAVPMTLADIQTAFEQQKWVHVRFDAGQIKDLWTHLQTGESYITRFDGSVIYLNDQTNVRLWYWKESGVIGQDTPTLYAAGQTPPPWTPHTAWQEFVSSFEQAAATTQPANSPPPSVVITPDTLNGLSVVRFDHFGIDALGRRFLYVQLWADPRTHLPLRIKTRLQVGERGDSGKLWSTGDYDFPATGPADLYALGVPRGLPIQKSVTAAPANVQPILDAINRNYDNFLKNYRAIIMIASPHGIPPLDMLDIVWRDGDQVRQDHHLPAVELQYAPTPPLPALTPTALLTWASHHEPTEKLLMNSQREYSWASAGTAKTTQPQVLVMRHHAFPLLPTSAWPESIQWPTRYDNPDFTLLAANPDTPPGCIGLRAGNQGNTRTDYYIDPQNDYVCVKQVRSTARGTQWTKARTTTLSGLYRVNGRVVAAAQRLEDYGDPATNLATYTETFTIDLVPLTKTDYPSGTFDPASLTTGAKVEGF